MCEPECTSSTSHIDVPGLLLIEDFISIEEESELLDGSGIASESFSSWITYLTRRVQVRFEFSTNYTHFAD